MNITPLAGASTSSTQSLPPREKQAYIPELSNGLDGLTDQQKLDKFNQRSIGELALFSRAGNALADLSEGVNKANRILQVIDPTIKAKDWDFTIEKDKVVISGDISDAQKSTIEKVLNAVPGLIDSAKELQQSAVSALDVNSDSSVPGYRLNRYTNQTGLDYYKDVAGQLSGKMSFKHLLEDTLQYTKSIGDDKSEDLTMWGNHVMDVIKAQLTQATPVTENPG